MFGKDQKNKFFAKKFSWSKSVSGHVELILENPAKKNVKKKSRFCRLMSENDKKNFILQNRCCD